MHIDIHYYRVYAIARAAGLQQGIARRIADASQFVDDYTEETHIETSDGTLISYCPSGHGMVCDATLDPVCLNNADPHRVWVPFHFVPGNEAGPYTIRMRCGKDGAVAQTGGLGFESIRNAVSGIIAFEGKKEDRIEKWQNASSAGNLGFGFAIPAYADDQITSELNGRKDQSMDQARKARIWRFAYAVEVIRNMILVDLLPDLGLIA